MSEITGARGTGALADMLRPDYRGFARKSKRRVKKRRVPPRPAQRRY